MAFGEKDQVVVGGSDHGVVYVFDRMTSNKLDELRVAEGGMVQTITVGYRVRCFVLSTNTSQTHSQGGIHTIVAATSNIRQASVISVWVYESTPPEKTTTSNVQQVLNSIVKMALLLAVVTFVYVNFDTVVS